MHPVLKPDPEEPAAETPFYKALVWRVNDPDEALHIAITHRRRAAEERAGIPATLDTFLAQSRARLLESRAWNHDQIVEVCERHAARLRAAIDTEPADTETQIERCRTRQQPLNQPDYSATADCGGDCHTLKGD